MADSKQAPILWPDLKRFGIRLSVAWNPSLGRNFLRLEVEDRKKTIEESGLDAEKDDFLRIMRTEGFAYMASEASARRTQAYRRDASEESIQEELTSLSGRLYFYSPSLAINKDMLRRIVPNLADSDFRMMDVSEIKHLDFRYVDEEAARVLQSAMSALPEGAQQVFYSTPADRELLARLAQKKAPVFEGMGLGGVWSRPTDPDVESIAELTTLKNFKTLLAAQSLLVDGMPLKTPMPSALGLVYTRREDAVAANGGVEEGVEQHEWPWAQTVAFDYPQRRILVLQDARYMEYRQGGIDEVLRHRLTGPVPFWDFLDKTADLRRLVGEAQAKGVFDESSLIAEAGIDAAALHLKALQAASRAALEGERVPDHADRVTLTDFLGYSGLTMKAAERIVGQPFLDFLDKDFGRLAESIQQKEAVIKAQAVIAAGMQSALAAVQSAQTDPTQRREDAGVKIGGARKDYARRWLDESELASLTPRERVEVVTKENVWPALNFTDMREAGVEPAVAWAIREIRNGLPVNPYRGGWNSRRRDLAARANQDLTMEQCESFVRALSVFRDRFSNVKTQSEFSDAMMSVFEEFCVRSDGRTCTWDSDNWFFDGVGYKFMRNVFPSIYIYDNGRRDSSGIRSMLYRGEGETGNEWEWAAKKSKRAVAADGEVQEKVAKPEPEMPHLDKIERVGIDYRNGKDVDEALMMEVFGFRGVEYGNWLPQGERQVVLNHAFDAFMDLAASLKLPPKAMGLGGELAVAFGSRGRGGKRAAMAHYEPGLVVINLTRMTGAGSMAHEWGHAFDYWLSRACGASQTRALTEYRAKNAGRIRTSELGAKFIALSDALNVRYRTKDEVIANLSMVEEAGVNKPIIALVQARLTSLIAALDRLLPEDKRNSVFREFAMAELDKCLVADEENPNMGRMVNVDAFVRNLESGLDLQAHGWRERYDATHIRFYSVRMSDWLAERNEKLEKAVAGWTPTRYEAKSRFLTDAEEFDSYRSKPYWSTRVELFARAFESWVQDEVEKTPGQCSQYLVYGNEARESAEFSGYPRGEERSRFAAAFEGFFNDARPELLRHLGLIEPKKEASTDLEAA